MKFIWTNMIYLVCENIMGKMKVLLFLNSCIHSSSFILSGIFKCFSWVKLWGGLMLFVLIPSGVELEFSCETFLALLTT